MIAGSIEQLDLDIRALVDETLSPKARSAAIAEFAREVLGEAEDVNLAALGTAPTHTTAVDGVDGVSEDRVRPDGTIEYEFQLLPDIFGWIAAQLRAFAPVDTGRFKESFLFFVDGILTDVTAAIPVAAEYLFVSSAPYASKIEGEFEAPESEQAPNGVFEAVAALAQLRAGDRLQVAFTYLVPPGTSPVSPTGRQTRTPAITINPGK